MNDVGKKIEEAIIKLVTDIGGYKDGNNVFHYPDSNDVMKVSQAVLNLANAKAQLEHKQ